MPKLELGGASVSVGSVTITPPTEVTGTAGFEEITTGTVVAAGKLRVEIRNMGFVQAGDANEDITVNGNVMSPGSAPLIFDAALQAADEEFKLLPAFTIVNALGSRVRITTFE